MSYFDIHSARVIRRAHIKLTIFCFRKLGFSDIIEGVKCISIAQSFLFWLRNLTEMSFL